MKSPSEMSIASSVRTKSSSELNLKGDVVPPPTRGRLLQREGSQISRQTSPTSTCFSSVVPFKDVFALKRQIDRGSYSVVYEAIHLISGESYAVKVYDRTKFPSVEEDLSVYNEVSNLRYLERHRYAQDNLKERRRKRRYDIVRLIDFFEDAETFYLVLELMRGGDVFSRVVERHFYTEIEARYLAKCLLDSVKYMHECGVVHRDLKPDNLLLAKEGNDIHVKIADFGFSAKTRIGGMQVNLTQRCGTPAYVAPEVLKGGPYNEKVDMWSVGAIIYFVLGGYPAFVDDKPRNLFKKILHADYEFHEEDWDHVSDEAKSLIRSLLTVDPTKRLSASAALKHPWFRRSSSKYHGHTSHSTLHDLKNDLANVNLTEQQAVLEVVPGEVSSEC